jgi:hypothetical protein
MKRFCIQTITRGAIFLATVIVPLACMDAGWEHEKFFLAYGTAGISPAGELSILLDEQDTILRVDETLLPRAFFRDSMRLFIDYSILERAAPDDLFHYRVRLNRATEIPTKELSLGSSSDVTPFSIGNHWISRGFLTIEYLAPPTHEISLFRSVSPTTLEDDDKISLGLHCHFSLGSHPLSTHIVSFALYKSFPSGTPPVDLWISYHDANKNGDITTILHTYHP